MKPGSIHPSPRILTGQALDLVRFSGALDQQATEAPKASVGIKQHADGSQEIVAHVPDRMQRLIRGRYTTRKSVANSKEAVGRLLKMIRSAGAILTPGAQETAIVRLTALQNGPEDREISLEHVAAILRDAITPLKERRAKDSERGLQAVNQVEQVLTTPATANMQDELHAGLQELAAMSKTYNLLVNEADADLRARAGKNEADPRLKHLLHHKPDSDSAPDRAPDAAMQTKPSVAAVAKALEEFVAYSNAMRLDVTTADATELQKQRAALRADAIKPLLARVDPTLSAGNLAAGAVQALTRVMLPLTEAVKLITGQKWIGARMALKEAEVQLQKQLTTLARLGLALSDADALQGKGLSGPEQERILAMGRAFTHLAESLARRDGPMVKLLGSVRALRAMSDQGLEAWWRGSGADTPAEKPAGKPEAGRRPLQRRQPQGLPGPHASELPPDKRAAGAKDVVRRTRAGEVPGA